MKHKTWNKLIKEVQKGQIALVAVLVTASLAVIVSMSLATIATRSQKIIYSILSSRQSYYTVESGLEDTLLRIINPTLNHAASSTLTLNGGSAITTVVQTGEEIDIIASGTVNNMIRKLQVELEIIPTVVSFYYGMQVGSGGLILQNNAIINGNLYADGDVIGTNSAKIIGDAWVSGVHTLRGFEVTQDAHAHNIEDSSIGRDAYYQTISGTTVGRDSYPGSPDPEPQTLPITDEQITDWKTIAASGGLINTNYILDDATASLGPVKINGAMNIKGDAILTLTGPIWVTGNITLENNAAIQIHPSYGDNSEILITDGAIIVKNNFMICGSEGYNDSTNDCNPETESYVLLLSTSSASPAISLENNADLRAMLYANNGQITFKNNISVVAATGYSLEVSNNAGLTYETGLINAYFTSGPSGGWGAKSWKEIP